MLRLQSPDEKWSALCIGYFAARARDPNNTSPRGADQASSNNADMKVSRLFISGHVSVINKIKLR